MRTLARRNRLIVMYGLSVIVASGTAALAGAASNGFAGASRGLNALDVALLERAVKQALDSQKQGATAVWEDKQSGEAGRASVLRVYEQNGMMCAEIEHVYTTGASNRYVVPYCRITSGEWKIAF